MEEPSLIESPWLWTGVAAVVIAAVTTGLVLGLRKDSCTCLGPDPMSCVDCDP